MTSLLAAVIAGFDRPEATTCEVTDADGTVVRNTRVGEWPAELSWREVWRVGGSEEAEELIFPADVAVSPNGSVAIADWGLAEVVLLDPDGEWLGPVMTRGEGPGEVQAPAAATWEDANTLLVLDFGTFRVTTLDVASRSATVTAVDPAFLSPVFASGEITFVALQADHTVWLEFPGPIEDGWEERSFVRWSPASPVNETVARSRARVLERTILPAWPRSLVGVGEETWVVSAPDGSYELTVSDRDDTMLVRFCHPAEALPLSPAERGDEADERVPDAWRLALSDLGEPPEPAIISRILVDADGRIWVQRDRPAPRCSRPTRRPGSHARRVPPLRAIPRLDPPSGRSPTTGSARAPRMDAPHRQL